jgi:hypothetical protein
MNRSRKYYLHGANGVLRQDVLVVKGDGDVAKVLLLGQVAQVVLELQVRGAIIDLKTQELFPAHFQ